MSRSESSPRQRLQAGRRRNGALPRLALAALGGGLAAAAGAADYAADPAFNGGHYYADAFASDSSLPDHHYAGSKVARASNGDVVVAALVDEGSLDPQLYTAVGLIRYDRAGVRVPWTAPDPATTRHFDNYVFVPGTRNDASIDDLRIVDGRIVLLHTYRSVHDLPESSLGWISVLDDGGRLLWSDVLYLSDGSSWGVRGGGLATYADAGSTYVLVASTHVAAKRPRYQRFRLEAGGNLTLLDDVWLATSACWNEQWQCDATGIAVSQDGPDEPPRIYVSYAFRGFDGDDADVVVSRIDPHGNGDPAWDPNNVHWNLSDGGSRDDVPVGIAVRRTGAGSPSSPYRDEIFVATRSARTCRPGIGLIRFDHDGGVAGRVLAGGSASNWDCITGSTSADVPSGLALDADRLVVVGSRTVHSRRFTWPADALVRRFGFDLAVRGEQTFAYPIGSPRQRASEFSGAAVSGPDEIVATGSLTYPATAPGGLGGKRQVGTLRLRWTP
ncbi:hypothetical protein [Dokdonella ginsengisoli]|uniref:Uncharacterized protein n=1 Tax=Dokdonella ginsengisoli TaxID=363846 RepID=A0ABV9QYR1_9GAMM